jgi:hypothetical protein
MNEPFILWRRTDGCFTFAVLIRAIRVIRGHVRAEESATTPSDITSSSQKL